MTEIKKAEELVAVAVRQGVQMNLVEADIVLSYMESHGFALMSDEQFQMALHDTEEEEKYGYTKDQPYTIREAVEFCQEMNEELLQDAAGKEQRDDSYILDLRKDDLILAGLAEKAAAVIPPVIRRYNIIILEYLKRVVPVEAASWEEAKAKVERAWNDGEYVLSADDFAGVSFNTTG
mgnify:CR=1 FL=1